jgi:RNA polymerase sigma factor for flagellar operon FliA
MEPEDIIALLAQRMAELPSVQKKVLAMYYYENMQLRDIAACFGLTESKICQIHLQAVASLRSLFYSVKC